MPRFLVAFAAVAVMVGPALAQKPAPSYKTMQLTEQFYSEGAYYGDFNKDGKMDVVSGPFWYEGPEFKIKHQVYAPKAFKGDVEYSDNFLTFVYDLNGDGWADVLYIGFPAKEAFWYENPAGKGEVWKQHLAFASVGGESPMFGDVNGDGKPELVCVLGDTLGYATADWKNPEKAWTFTAVTPKGGYGMFTHGSAFGDVNGDGRMDILENNGWWEQPAKVEAGKPWAKHEFKFADAAAQMLVYDVDGDAKNDVVTALHCHEYGIVWWKQVRDAGGQISFEKKAIVGSKPEENPQGICFSQAHAFDLADFNGDGLMDFVVGKRWWAHGPKGDKEPNAPAVVYWFELKRDKEKGVEFVGHLIDNNSGVGTQVAAADLNGDGVPDVVVGNKKGTFVSLSEVGK